jgi:hypothetical protein
MEQTKVSTFFSLEKVLQGQNEPDTQKVSKTSNEGLRNLFISVTVSFVSMVQQNCSNYYIFCTFPMLDEENKVISNVSQKSFLLVLPR